jgi:hypothetical protein
MASGQAAVNLPAVTDSDDQDDELRVDDVVDSPASSLAGDAPWLPFTVAPRQISGDSCMWLASTEDVPAFVELESGGPSPGACRVVGHG